MKTIGSMILVLVVAIVAGVVGVIVWVAIEIGNRAIDAVDALGPGLFQAGALVTFAVFCIVVIGGAVAIVRWMTLRSRVVHAHPDTALYPMMHHGGARYVDLNADKAHLLAVMATGRRPTAATVSRVLDWTPPEPEPPALPAPVASFPQRVEVYSSPIPPKLAIPVGVDGAGRAVSLPLRGLGNVVVGGLPNYGKSELLGSMAAGLLRQDPRGERSQLAVVDMKLVSFGNMPALAALRWPVATDIDEAHEIIAAVRAECAQRYVALREAGARTLEEYETRTGERLPYVTVLIDEIADLTCDDDRGRRERFLASAMELARKGRAAGVGLVMATQRPSVDVLPSSLRNLAGAAVAFKVQRNHDSVAVLGEPGAEALPSTPGRCLVKRGEVIECQAYACGLEGGRFDAFLASMPAAGLAAPTWPVRVGTAVPEPVNRAEVTHDGGIPVFRTDASGPYTAEQIAHIRARYADLGSLKAVQRELYGQEGGHWFYAIRDAVQSPGGVTL